MGPIRKDKRYQALTPYHDWRRRASNVFKVNVVNFYPPHAQDLPERFLTPYQGRHRAWGKFRCLRCNKRWTSNSTWANTGQECENCHVIVYPHKQVKLEQSNEQDGEPKALNDGEEIEEKPIKRESHEEEEEWYEQGAHLTDFCEKCQRPRHSCGHYMYR